MINKFIRSLKSKPSSDLFNPWFECDETYDHIENAPAVRRRQLEIYLKERLKSARYLFIAEALGYQGGHFTGIAMTSERILLGHQQKKYGVRPDYVFADEIPVRTSRPDYIRNGMTEPTATIMWGAIVEMGIDPYEIVLWNAVPWHPYNREKGLLSNRTPTTGELDAGLQHLGDFIELFEDVKLVAVGKKCEKSLCELERKHIGVRHPANGGAPKFRKQLRQMLVNK